ncbi:hypothetical protein T10_13343 [Trichinella papuae]|uniref:Uncharacterized protein n=1 Tax=Trichinella papuae TaxID=268474 RepID=A0A0V1MNV2_9BILA|nr:hypothetical protein T10_13343 [Trichinella papuae]
MKINVLAIFNNNLQSLVSTQFNDAHPSTSCNETRNKKLQFVCECLTGQSDENYIAIATASSGERRRTEKNSNIGKEYVAFEIDDGEVFGSILSTAHAFQMLGTGLAVR